MSKVRLVQIELLDELDRISKKYNIKYQLFAGTLLGAVRHNGYIPWDDDIDVAMLREDYERFISVCEKELGADYFLQTPDLEGSPYPFSKLRKNNTLFVEGNVEHIDIHHGVFIDVFPMDNVFDRIRRYDSFVARFDGRKYYQNEFINLQNEVLQNEESLKSLFDVRPIHGDLSPNNAIVTEDGEILLIDLEFVSMGDPYTDLATFSHDGNYTPEQTIDLLKLYLERKPTDKEIYKLLTLCTLVSVMWYSWAVFKMTVDGQQGIIKFKPYRDLYLEYAIIMHDESKKYE